MAKKRRRSNGQGTIYQVDGKWISQISYYRDGKLKRPKRTSDKHADAVVRLDELRKEASQLDMNEQHHTVGSYLTEWLREVENGKQADNTHKLYKGLISKHIVPHIGRVKLSALKPTKIREMLNSLRDSDAGPRAVQLAFGVINTALAQAVKDDLIIKNPCASVNRPVHNKAEAVPFTREERERIFDLSEGTWFHPMYKFILATGLRSAEAYGLQWADIDQKSKTIHIQRQYINGDYAKLKSKYSDRYLDLTPGIERYLELQRKQLKARGFQKNLYVFCAPRGGNIRTNKHGNKYWNPLLEKAGVEQRGIHHLRHTFASELLAAGADLLVVSKLLGHSSPAITLKYYAHVMPPKRSQVAGQIEELFG